MTDIHSVEVGDQFESTKTADTLEVIKIWFEFCPDDKRWETSVTWSVNFNGAFQLSGKARDFVKTLQESSFVRVNKDGERSSNGVTTTLSPTPSVSSPDLKLKRWEDDFRKNAARYGLSSSDLGRKIKLGANRPRNFVIVGAKPSNYKMPILVKGKRGGIYKITAKQAKDGLV